MKYATAIISLCLLAIGFAAFDRQIATNSAVYGRDGVSALLAKSTAQNFNVTNTDTAVTIGVSKYIVRSVTVTNCSASFDRCHTS